MISSAISVAIKGSSFLKKVGEKIRSDHKAYKYPTLFHSMETRVLTMDEKGRLTVPADLRQKFKIREFVVLESFGIFKLVPKIPLKMLAGLTPDITLEDLRDETDRII